MPNLYSGDRVEFPQFRDSRGNLSFVEGNNHIPFDIKRIYYLYDVPAEAERGGHAHKALRQVIIAMSGSFDLILDDGKTKQTITLNRCHYGIYIGSMVWREMNNFSSGAVALVLASDEFDESDYIRDYNGFLESLGKASE